MERGLSINSVKRREHSGIQVIGRAAAVLRTLENQPDGLSLASIAERLQLPRSTVQRIVHALEAEDLLIAASPKARVRLGPALARLAASVETSAIKIAKPIMAQLAQDLGETVDLSVLTGDRAVFLERVIGTHSVYAIVARAEHYPLHCTANGRAMLAELADSDIEHRIGRSYERKTPRSLTSFAELIATLGPVRRTKVAFSVEENALGICGVGVAFRDVEGNLLSLSVPVPTSRFEDQKKRIAQRLLESRGQLQRHLGLNGRAASKADAARQRFALP